MLFCFPDENVLLVLFREEFSIVSLFFLFALCLRVFETSRGILQINIIIYLSSLI